MDDCDGGGGCTPSSEIVVQTQLMSVTGQGIFDCLRVPPWYNYWYLFESTRFRYKNTRKQITTNADCSTTETVLDIWYVNVYCWMDSVWPCSNPRYGSGICF